jgi:hypothetical protein
MISHCATLLLLLLMLPLSMNKYVLQLKGEADTFGVRGMWDTKTKTIDVASRWKSKGSARNISAASAEAVAHNRTSKGNPCNKKRLKHNPAQHNERAEWKRAAVHYAGCTFKQM